MSNTAPLAQQDAVAARVVKILEDMTGDWDLEFDGKIDLDTQIIGDLAFESIDIVQLVVALEEGFNKRGIPFEKLLMVDGRYVNDLSVAEVVEFLQANL